MKHQEKVPYDNHIVFIPRRTIECDELLEMHGLLFDDKIRHFALDLLQLDDDLLSLEMPRSFANHLLDDDDSYKVYVQASVQRLETVFGKIKYKFAKGNISSRLINRINEKNATSSYAMMAGEQSEIDCLIMMDRSVDLVSPFCVQ
jgi:hypothetical protein